MNTNPLADSLVSCVQLPHNFNPQSIMCLDANGSLSPYIEGSVLSGRRQEKLTYFARNGAAIYITRSHHIDKYLLGGTLIPYLMNKISSIDIDDMEDMLIAESFLKNKSIHLLQ